jgi:hypothetical protein
MELNAINSGKVFFIVYLFIFYQKSPLFFSILRIFPETFDKYYKAGMYHRQSISIMKTSSGYHRIEKSLCL